MSLKLRRDAPAIYVALSQARQGEHHVQELGATLAPNSSILLATLYACINVQSRKMPQSLKGNERYLMCLTQLSYIDGPRKSADLVALEEHACPAATSIFDVSHSCDYSSAAKGARRC